MSEKKYIKVSSILVSIKFAARRPLGLGQTSVELEAVRGFELYGIQNNTKNKQRITYNTKIQK